MKGLIVDITRERAGSIKETLENMYKMADFKVIETVKESFHIIDTRNIDMMLISTGSAQTSEIIETAGPFVRSIIESGENIVKMRINKNMKYIDKNRILCIEVMARNCYIYTPRNKYPLYRQSLNHVMDQIGDPYFVRCHKSYAINVKNLEDLHKERRGMWKASFKQKTDTECPVSENYRDMVMKKHEEWVSITEKYG